VVGDAGGYHPETDTNENAMPDPTQATHDTVDKPVKKSYDPPRILSRECLEAIAGLCGKGNAVQCSAGPINS